MLDADELEENRQSPEDAAVLEGIVWRKLDRYLVPLCNGLFVIAAVDQINIGNARVAGMQLALHITDYQFTMALMATSLTYLLGMFPTAVLLQHVGPHIIFPTLAILFGIVTASQGFVKNYSGLLACRCLLGLADGGIFSCICLYFSFFYPRKKLQIRIATLSASFSLCGVCSGLLAAAISHINGGGRPGWAWIFILEGIFAIVFGLICLFLLPRSPEKTRFLMVTERAYVVSTLKRAGSVSADYSEDTFSWIEVINSIKSLHVWLLSLSLFFMGSVIYPPALLLTLLIIVLLGMLLIGLSLFEPTIVESLGYTGIEAQLMSVPPYVASLCLALTSALISDRYQCRGYMVIFFTLMGLIGFIMFYASTSNHVRYGSLFFSITGANCAMPALITWLQNNSAPYVRRATATTVAFVLFQVGGVFATWLFGYLSPAPNYTLAMIMFIVVSLVIVVLSMANLVYLLRKNRLKVEKREGMEKKDEPKGLGDRGAWFIYSL